VVDQKNKLMGVGIIVRDHNGHVWASMCTTKPYVTDPTVAVELCRELGLQAILLEGNAKEIVSAMENGGDSLGRYRRIVANARYLLSIFQS
jgi:hypothetical protein